MDSSKSKTRSQICSRYLCSFCAFLFSHIGLCTLVLSYATFGAFLFRYLESTHARKVRKKMISIKDRLLFKLWNITDDPLILQDDIWKPQASLFLRQFSRELIDLVNIEGYDGKFNHSQPLFMK